MSNCYSETRQTPDHKYEHIPKDSKVVASAEWEGMDIAKRKTYRIGRRYYVWDSRRGDWEVFSYFKRHLGCIKDFGMHFYKSEDPKKRLVLR